MVAADSRASAPRLILLSGLAADERFLHRQHAAFPHAELVPWIPWEPRESLAHYAERLAERVQSAVSPEDRPRPLVVAGTSLGGMLALEIGRHLSARRIVMIASCRDPAAVTDSLRRLERISRALPLPVMSLVRWAGRPFLGRATHLTLGDSKLVVEMGMACPMSFMRWASRAILSWPGLPDPGVPVDHIHGDRDWVIPHHRLRHEPTLILRGGPHVLNLTHADKVNQFLKQSLDAAADDARPAGRAAN